MSMDSYEGTQSSVRKRKTDASNREVYVAILYWVSWLKGKNVING